MNNERGNFLLQTLLAVSLIVAFIPFIIKKIYEKENNIKISAVSKQIETFFTASKIYISETLYRLPYEITILSKDKLIDTLEPFGLPLGFNYKTIFEQEIKLIINKTKQDTFVYLDIIGGKLNQLERANIISNLGYSIKENNNSIQVYIPIEEEFNNIVKLKETEKDIFYTDINMGGYDIKNVKNIDVLNMDSSLIDTDSIFVLDKNIIPLKNIKCIKCNIKGTGLSINNDLEINTMIAKTIGKYGNNINITSDKSFIDNFTFKEGYSNFNFPLYIKITGDLNGKKINLDTDKLNILNNINVSLSQENKEYKEGIETDEIRTNYITLYNQTSKGIKEDNKGESVIEINLGNITKIPDIKLKNINNDEFDIIKDVYDSKRNNIKCKNIIESINIEYDKHSLSQYIVCQYVFWNRLEKRINIKQCLLDNKNDC